jgi:hypothetical protein
VPRLGIVNVIGVVEAVLVVCRPARPSMLGHHAMLVASHAIGVIERFAHVGAGIEIGVAAAGIPFVVGVRPRCRNDHADASAESA